MLKYKGNESLHISCTEHLETVNILLFLTFFDPPCNIIMYFCVLITEYNT